TPAGPRRGQRRLSERRSGNHGQGRRDRQSARRLAPGHHGGPGRGASGGERPDIVCRKEIKAASDQIPAALCEMEGYWCYWHGGKGYSGVGLHVSKTMASERPAFLHPEFNYENRIAAVDLR